MERAKEYIQYFEPRLIKLADSLEKRPGGYLLTENTKEEVIQTGEMRLRRFAGDYFMDLSSQIVKDDNPLASCLNHTAALWTKRHMNSWGSILAT